MVFSAVQQLAPAPGALLVIENVGNLVCPALFDLGEGKRVVLLSVTEGDDKPEKYPHMFSVADLVVLTKIDLLPHVDFDVERARRAVAQLNPRAEWLQLSAKTGAGMPEWLAWLEALRIRPHGARPAAHSVP
jgi:hydrogenase nickel incorporation protein HypB